MTGCSASDSPTEVDGPIETMEDLIAAAQAEGELTVYGSPPEPALMAATEAFSEKYDITVNTIRIVGGEIAARYPAEKSAGAPTADAILLNLATFVPEALEQGIVTAIEDLDIPGYPWDFPEEFLRPEYGTAVVGLQPRGITYNTEFIAEGEITDWDDILDPKYAGHVGVPDPGSAPVYIGHWYTVAEQFGGAEQFLTSVGGQLAPNAVYASGAPATAAAGAGEVWFIPMNIGGLTKQAVEQGAPLEFVIPPRTTADEQTILVNSDPDHPNAAKLFAAFMMSEEGSLVMAEVGGEMSPFDADNLPELWSWPLELADEQRDNVVNWITGG